MSGIVLIYLQGRDVVAVGGIVAEYGVVEESCEER